MWYPLQVNHVKFHEIRTFLYATLIRVIADLFCYILSKDNVRHKYSLRLLQEEFEDTKEVIRIRKSKMNKQQNDEKKKNIRTNNDLQITHTTTDRATRTPLKTGVNSGASEG